VLELTPRPVAGTVDELIGDATSREPMVVTDSRSGARFERVVIGGERFVLKHLSIANDWIARAYGDLGPWSVRVWSSGLLDAVPASIDHTYAGAAVAGREGAVLMHDIGPYLVPDVDAPVRETDHVAFLDDLAALHAAFWGWTDDVGLTPFGNRFLVFSPWVMACEASLGFPNPVPRIARDGWSQLEHVAPRMAAVLAPLRIDPSAIVAALETTPHTFVHGDAKLGNLGRDTDGRTILIDWAIPGQSVGGLELAYYLALNGSRLPPGFGREAAIAEYRAALERHGIDTGAWWEHQLGVSLLGMMVLLGWRAASGATADLGWWEARVLEGIEMLA
jgi:hypothetical protein